MSFEEPNNPRSSEIVNNQIQLTELATYEERTPVMEFRYQISGELSHLPRVCCDTEITTAMKCIKCCCFKQIKQIWLFLLTTYIFFFLKVQRRIFLQPSCLWEREREEKCLELWGWNLGADYVWVFLCRELPSHHLKLLSWACICESQQEAIL